MLLTSFISKYKQNFNFLKKDLRSVAKKQNRHLMIILLLFVLLNFIVFAAEFLKNGMIFKTLNLYGFYFAHILAGLLCLIITLVLNRLPSVKGRLLPVYIMNLTYECLNFFYLNNHDIPFFSSAMTFADYEIVCILLFDLNPIFLSITMLIADIVYAFSNFSFIQVTNVWVFSILMMALCWWKRYNRVQNFAHIHSIAEEKKKNEELLLNILPPKIVSELKSTGSSKPEHFENVSVMFTDFQNFTSKTEKMSPDLIISELNDIFSNFDIIIDQFGCTRIKTIGDSYLTVCGLPEKDTDHAEKLVNCGLAFIDYLNKRNETSEIKWKMRIGINSGAVTAGIVGTKKYLYDIFGDTVNTASRMESNSEPMRINISEATKKLVDNKFTVEERKSVAVKGKGLMTMYFVN